MLAATAYTIGHSTRPLTELVDLLKHVGVALLCDTRSFPRSRTNPQFNIEHLDVHLPLSLIHI